ncbi:MAG: M20 family metallo-hydrolase [Chloroflexi bacterium]|nr:M20 family metallo-hydrolase [Chloroflexota bacterium]
MTDIMIDSTRIQSELETLAAFSDAPAPAVTRVLFTPVELSARAYIKQLMADAGLSVREDAVGNVFARWDGEDPGLPAIATGSHIDAIPYSGRYDGTVGVLGAIEAIRALKRAGYRPLRSIEVLMFTAEEPTRFGIGCLGSRALAGRLSPDALLALKDTHGIPFDEVRSHAGYTGDLTAVQLAPGHYHSFVELHIEQGPRLEASGVQIGIVNAIAAPATLRVVLHGSGGHAGTVLMPERRDALAAAAELILAVERTGRASESPDAVATVGLCHVYPGAVNSIASRVTLEIDIRDIDLASRDRMVEQVGAAAHAVAVAREIDIERTVLNADRPCYGDAVVVAAIRDAADETGSTHVELVSRAYHDTLFMAEICPVSMIFVPSRNGYSHRPDEYTPPEDIARGVDVLARTLVRLAAS